MSRSRSIKWEKTAASSCSGRKRLQRRKTADTQGALSALHDYMADDSGKFLDRNMTRTAGANSTAELGLQLSSQLVNSQPGAQDNAMEPLTPSKLAAVASSLKELSSLVGELRSAYAQSMQVAAALTGAVKLAQDGLADVEDVFDLAKEAIETGSVKLSAVDDLFNESPGETVQRTVPSKAASGAQIPGMPTTQGKVDSDPLTVYLRSRQR